MVLRPTSPDDLALVVRRVAPPPRKTQRVGSSRFGLRGGGGAKYKSATRHRRCTVSIRPRECPSPQQVRGGLLRDRAGSKRCCHRASSPARRGPMLPGAHWGGGPRKHWATVASNAGSARYRCSLPCACLHFLHTAGAFGGFALIVVRPHDRNRALGALVGTIPSASFVFDVLAPTVGRGGRTHIAYAEVGFSQLWVGFKQITLESGL